MTGRFGVLLFATMTVVGCRPKQTVPTLTSASANAPIPSAMAPGGAEIPLAAAISAADLRVEARRGLSAESDPLFVRHRSKLDAHFGVSPFPLAYQVVPVEMGKAAVLLQSLHGDARPLIWLLDSKGELLWAKEHPMGGVNAGASEPTLTPGPDGHLCLAWCNGSTDSVAFRRWAEDGGSFADYDALHVDACDALSVLYWPGRGWVLGIATATGAILELIDLNGERAWGNDGIALPWTWQGPAPVSLALDTLDSVLLFRLGRSGAQGSGEYLFASRWSADGRPMWPGPLSVKRLEGTVTDPRVRVVLRPGHEGAIEASLGSGIAGPGVSVDVQSDGTITRH